MSNKEPTELDVFVEELTTLQITIDNLQVRLRNLQLTNAELDKELKNSVCSNVNNTLKEMSNDDV